jgi:subtilase family serine protease
MVLAVAFGLVPAEAGTTRALRGHTAPASAVARPLGRLAPTNSLRLAIGLPLRHQEALTNLLHQLYDPANPSFHHFLTPPQFTAAFGPAETDYRAVLDFARSNNLAILSTYPNRALLEVTGTVSDIEKAFHVNLHLYQHPSESRTFYAPDIEPSVDSDIPVLFIGGLSSYQMPHPASLHFIPAANGQNAQANAGSQNGSYVGLDFRAAYVPGLTNTGTGQSVGLVEFDSYYPADVTDYLNLQSAGLSGSSVTLSNVVVSPTVPPGTGNVEVALDIEMAISMAPGLSKIYVYEATNNSVEPDALFNRIASDNLSRQISCSWSGFDDPTIQQDYLQFAVQGQSFFVASGDSGAYYSPTYNPVSPPCDNPNVTVVGGTTLFTTGPKGSWSSETAWNWFTHPFSGLSNSATSGGISPTWSIPSWQTGVSMSGNQGSTSFRNLPDVALVADNLFLYGDNGQQLTGGGTSAAAPLWAGLTALINQQRAAQGQSPEGFINPALYAIGKGAAYSSCFHDITVGNNTNYVPYYRLIGHTYHLETNYNPSEFFAVAGYDLCTGWGSPNGTALFYTLTPEPLQVTPSAGFASSGPYGGPFNVTSQTFTLTNDATASFNWTLANLVPWLFASPGSGTLVSGGPATSMNISLNSVASNLTVGSYTNTVWFTNLNDAVAQSRQFILTVSQAVPVVTWSPPASITYGTALSSTQLDATANVPGTFSYNPANGTILDSGTRTLSVVFNPTDTTDFTSVTNTVTLVISPAPLNVNAANANRLYGQPNPAFQGTIVGLQNGDNITASYNCSATSSNPAGSYSIVPTLNDPANLATNYVVSLFNGTLVVAQAPVAVTWATPAPITYGTALSATQLNATAKVPGTFAYNPTNGAILYAGTNALSVIFTPTDAVDYTGAIGTVPLVVAPAALTVTAADVARPFGQPNPAFLGAITGLQNGDNITASYNSIATNFSPVGTYPIVPSLNDAANLETNYTVTLVNGILTVNQTTAAIIWTNLTPILYGTALSATQLSASADVPGTFTYNPHNGAVLYAGTNALSVLFAPTDAVDYTSANGTVPLIVSPATLTVTAADVTRPFGQTNPTFLGAITGLQNGDNITASYNSIATTFSPVGTDPIVPSLNDAADLETNYSVTLVNGTLTVIQAVANISWTAPGPISSGTALSSAQLNATADVPGTFAYNPSFGTDLSDGTNTLSVAFTPTDAIDYSGASASVSLVVNPPAAAEVVTEPLLPAWGAVALLGGLAALGIAFLPRPRAPAAGGDRFLP